MMRKLLLLLAITFISIFKSQFSGGTGSDSDPYIISNINDLKFLSDNSTYWGKCFSQNENIDASATDLWNGGLGFSPIGNYATPFKGKYKGNGYFISNLYINRPTSDYIGLFGYCETALFNDINLDSVQIKGKAYVGGLVGYMNYPLIFGSSLLPDAIIKCSVKGNISGVSGAGGIGGTVVHCNVKQCSSDSVVTSTNAGGLFSLAACNISECSVKGTVKGNDSAGFVSEFYDGLIDNSYTTVTVDGGYGFAKVVQLYSRPTGILSSCYFAGTVVNNSIPKLIGNITGTVLNNVNMSFWDNTKTNFTGLSNVLISSRSTAELNLKTTFTNAGWDFSSSGPWAMDDTNINGGYPVLRNQTNTMTTSDIVNSPEKAKCYLDNNFTKVSVDADIKQARIYSFDGKLINSVSKVGRFINLSGLNNGIYILKGQYVNGQLFDCKFRYVKK